MNPAGTSETGPLYGAVEAGGTKFVCAAGTLPPFEAQGHTSSLLPSHVETTSFPTTTPEQTIGRVIEYFSKQERMRNSRLVAIGIGSFGPLDLNPASPSFGYITSTPKPGWSNTDMAGIIGSALGVPVSVDTDVNVAALGESRWGAALGLDTFLYLTVGTGIGGGGLANDRLMHGLLHPEMGHIRIPHDRSVDPFPGACPYHGDCLEGLASGTALERRWGKRAEGLGPDHPAWPLQAHYLALALTNFICSLSPQRIVLGGGIMQQAHLFPMIRQEVQQLLNGYVQAKQIIENESIAGYIVPPALGSRAGVLGALALAQRAVADTVSR